MNMEETKENNFDKDKEIKTFYKQNTIKLIRNCENERWLRAIYSFVKRLLE